VQTLEPLAEAAGIPIELAQDLAEGASGRGALELVLALAADGPVAACTHGDVLLDALVELRSAQLPLDGPFDCKKGSTWVLDVDAGSFRGGRYLLPPAVDKAKA
jgi:broad specificity phosphatase PhoE